MTQNIPEGQRIRIDRSLTRPMYCKCGCGAFIPIMTFRYCPSVANPTGQEIILPEQGFQCTFCKTIYQTPSELQSSPRGGNNEKPKTP